LIDVDGTNRSIERGTFILARRLRGVRLAILSLLAVGALVLGPLGCGGNDPYDGESLEETQWVLSSGIETPPDTFLTLAFDRGMTGGWSGCNSFGVGYETDGDSITLGREVMRTDAACGGTPGGTAEETYWPLFFDVNGWRIDAGELVLIEDGDDVLRYAPRNAHARELVERLSSASE
jgi:heat shock protein HslJ